MIPKEDRWLWHENNIRFIRWDIQLIKEKLGIIEKDNDNENE